MQAMTETRSRRVTFSLQQCVHIIYQTSSEPKTDTSSTSIKSRVQLSKDRHVQQAIVRKAVLSWQRQMRERKEVPTGTMTTLAQISSKLSRCAGDNALETGRLNFLEVYGDYETLPRYSAIDSLKSDVPFQISAFPTIKLLPRKVSLNINDDANTRSRVKRQRT